MPEAWHTGRLDWAELGREGSGEVSFLGE